MSSKANAESNAGDDDGIFPFGYRQIQTESDLKNLANECNKEQALLIFHLCISCQGYELDLQLVSCLSKFQNLACLEFQGEIPLTVYHLWEIARCKQLTSLSIGESSIQTPSDLVVLAELPKLTSLTIGACNQLGRKGMRALSSLPMLKELCIGQRNLGIWDYSDDWSFASMKTLTVLRIGWRNACGIHAAKKIAVLRQLTTLEIGFENPLTDEGVYHLSKLENLTSLTLEGRNFLGAESAKHLARLERLAHLTFGCENNLGDEGALYLSRISTLTTLVIGGENKLTAAGVRHFLALRNLTKLTIGCKNGLKDQEDVIKPLFAQALPRCVLKVVWCF